MNSYQLKVKETLNRIDRASELSVRAWGTRAGIDPQVLYYYLSYRSTRIPRADVYLSLCEAMGYEVKVERRQ